MDGPHRARTEGKLKLLDAAVDAVDLDVGVGLGLVVHDLARAVGAEIALLAAPGETREDVEVLAAWGGVASDDGLPMSLTADGFVGPALELEGPTVEPVGSHADCLGQSASGAAITHALRAPVRPLAGPAAVLCAGFAGAPPHDVATTLWLAESYARLAALCLHDPDALEGLLSGGRLDGLTGCLTQAAFLQELRRELSRAQRHQRRLSCTFIDLDRFKRVNDRYGHLHGSRVLSSIAGVLREGIRDGDTLGRYGGDEFVVLLPDTDEAAALELSGRLRSRIARTMINLPHDPIDASIGVAQWRRGSPLEDLLGAADEALLAAKAMGGGTVVGAGALTRPPPSSAPAETAVRPIANASVAASVKEVLDVTAQFDDLGGASAELMAWELDMELARVVSAWSRAIKQGFLEPAGTDPVSGEEMWRLSDQGRQEREAPGYLDE